MIERVVKRIKDATDGKLGIALSLGEQTEETYLRWRKAGAHRYLLRIGTTNPVLYLKRHPADHSLEVRKECLALTLGLKMIAVTRIVLKDINIAAATALQALEYTGREQGLMCGANVIMPNVTETKFRPNYTLYNDKPCTDENSSMCRGCLSGRIQGMGETVGFGQWGDSKHYFKRSDEV